jgi:hypothetical protein
MNLERKARQATSVIPMKAGIQKTYKTVKGFMRFILFKYM